MTKKERKRFKKGLLNLVAESAMTNLENWKNDAEDSLYLSFTNKSNGIRISFFFNLFCIVTLPGSEPEDERRFSFFLLATMVLWRIFFPPSQLPGWARRRPDHFQPFIA